MGFPQFIGIFLGCNAITDFPSRDVKKLAKRGNYDASFI
jgi:hypothetical protein